MNNDVLLEVKNLKKYFPIKGGILGRIINYVRAVDDISFSVKRGEVFGIVGESGSGKSTLGRTILRLIKPTSGEIYFDGIDLIKLKNKELNRLRQRMQMVFQDPYTQLNPRINIKNNIGLALKHHFKYDEHEIEDTVGKVLEEVKLKAEWMYKYPHEFSGGQLQRIAIARALALKPDLIVLDEPTSALDVSIQAQILNLLNKLKKKYNLTYIFISHNLNIVEYISDIVAVMYLGKFLEIAPSEKLFKKPLHPYTKMLLSSIPEVSPEPKELTGLIGEIPSSMDIPSGCRFHPRCLYRKEICINQEPELKEVEKKHYVACFLYF